MNIRIGPISQKITPHLGTCLHCKTTWRFVKPHATPFNEHEGAFPLCEKCWRELTPEQRLPFYWLLLLKWNMEDGTELSEDERDALRAAVLNGL